MALPKIHHFLIAAVVATLLPVMELAEPARATSPGHNGKIAYTSGSHIWVVEPDGSDPTEVGPVGANHPSFSPDGSKIAFLRLRGDPPPSTPFDTLSVMDADGSDVKKLIDEEGLGAGDINWWDPTWSPDGTQIAVQENVYEGSGVDLELVTIKIRIVNAATGNLVRTLTAPNDGKYSSIAWHPTDASKLLARDSALYTVNPETGARTVVDNAGTATQPDWAPAGNTIVFAKQTETAQGDPGIYTVPAAGGDIAPLTDPGAEGIAGDLDPTYSPDGSLIAFSRNNVLHVMNANGSNQHSLGITGYWLSWGPLSNRIVVNNTKTDNGDTDAAGVSDGFCDSDADKDGNQCTLRAAIEEANAREGSDEIEFDIPKKQSKRIAPLTPLPDITGEVTIDGLTQGSGDNPVVQISGSLQTGDDPGLDVDAASVQIKGLIFTSFKNAPAIQLNGGDSSVKASWFGVKKDGSGYVASPNFVGVEVKSADNTIGGPGAANRNHFAASGDFNALKTFNEQIEDRDSPPSPESYVQAMRDLGSGSLVGEGASNTTIEGNDFGRAPNGDRMGRPIEFGNIPFGNTIGVLVSPVAGVATNTTIGGASNARGNIFSGNGMGIVALATGAGSISGLNIYGNLIGPKKFDSPNPQPSSFFGNVAGVVAALNVSGLKIGGAGGLGNYVQGNMTGLIIGSLSGAMIQNNDIGVDKKLFDLRDQMSIKEKPSVGLHNFLGVILGGTQNVQLGGPGGLGNRILGNFASVIVGGSSSQGNKILGNSIGLTKPPKGSLDDVKVGDYGTLIGVLHGEGSENTIGEPGAGNNFTGSGIGLISVKTTQETVQANIFDKAILGLISGAPAGMTVGGTTPGAANQFRDNFIGLLMAHREMKKDEREVSDTDKAPIGKGDREAPFTAENTDLALDVAAPVVGDTDLSATAAIIKSPPAPGTNNTIQGNYFGTNPAGANKGNTIGVWFLGDFTQTTFGTGNGDVGGNIVAHNESAGVWVGPPISGQSKIDLRGNSIFDNNLKPTAGVPGLGVDLLPQAAVDAGNPLLNFGVTLNDVGDADTGGNGKQNYPEIDSATAVGNDMTLTGTISSAPATTYSIELYASERCGRAGTTQGGNVTRYGEGEKLVKRYDVLTTGGGTAPIDTTATLPTGKRKVTTTATGPDGTSEFSKCVSVP